MPPRTRELLIAAAAGLLDAGGREFVTLLAGVAAEELAKMGESLAALREGDLPEGEVLRAALREYVAWALAYPARFQPGDPERMMSLLQAVVHGAVGLMVGGHLAAVRAG